MHGKPSDLVVGGPRDCNTSPASVVEITSSLCVPRGCNILHPPPTKSWCTLLRFLFPLPAFSAFQPVHLHVRSRRPPAALRTCCSSSSSSSSTTFASPSSSKEKKKKNEKKEENPGVPGGVNEAAGMEGWRTVGREAGKTASVRVTSANPIGS